MAQFSIIGTLEKIGPIIQKTDKFRMREFILIVDKSTKKKEITYPIKFQISNDRCDILSAIDIIEATKYNLNVEVVFDIRGREWRNKEGEIVIFNSLEASGLRVIDKVATGSVVQGTIDTGLDNPTQVPSPNSQYETAAQSAADMADDLPF